MGSHTREDHELEELAPILARCAPDVLADIGRCKLEALADSTSEQRYWRALHAKDQLVLTTPGAQAAARTLRVSGRDPDSGNELFAASRLLFIELLNQPAQQQFTAIIESDLETVTTDFGYILTPSHGWRD